MVTLREVAFRAALAVILVLLPANKVTTAGGHAVVLGQVTPTPLPECPAVHHRAPCTCRWSCAGHADAILSKEAMVTLILPACTAAREYANDNTSRRI